METQEKSLAWLALFASTGTLICCALPIVFVMLGLGATVAAISLSVPFLAAFKPAQGLGMFGVRDVAGFVGMAPVPSGSGVPGRSSACCLM